MRLRVKPYPAFLRRPPLCPQVKLPSFPLYEGLGFASKALPASIFDVPFPPLEGLVDGVTLTPSGAVPVEGAPAFSVPTGITVS